MKTKFLFLALLVFSLFAIPQSWADVLPDPNAQITLSWNDSSDVVNPSTGGTATLTVTGPTVGPSTIVNGYEGSTYGRTSGSSSLTDFGISFLSTSDVPEINPGGGLVPVGYAPSGVSAYLVEPGTTNTVSDFAYIFQMTKVGGGVYGQGVFLYTIHGLFQSDPVEGDPSLGLPMTVPTGFTGILETGAAQDVTAGYQFQDFSGAPYPILTVTLPSNLKIFMLSGLEGGGGPQGTPDAGSTLLLFGVALGALTFGVRHTRHPILQRA